VILFAFGSPSAIVAICTVVGEEIPLLVPPTIIPPCERFTLDAVAE
jgi:hypothetical protein